MTKPMLLSDFTRLPPAMRATAFDGLSALIDRVAERAPETHRFLRYQWFAAALLAYGGRARTFIVEHDGEATIALPLVGFGPEPAKLATLPGGYRPFRGFPATEGADDAAFGVLVERLEREINGLRIGPSRDGDPATGALIATARRRGWAVMDRFVADSFLFDLAVMGKEEGAPPAAPGQEAFDLRSMTGVELVDGGFELIAGVEERSLAAIEGKPDDAMFTKSGHGTFWRHAAADPVLADMIRVVTLHAGEAPVAFAFDLEAGSLRYVIAGGTDPAFAQSESLQRRMMAQAAAAGVTLIDCGEDADGYRHVAEATRGPAIRDWMLLRPGAPAMLGQVLKYLWRRNSAG